MFRNDRFYKGFHYFRVHFWDPSRASPGALSGPAEKYIFHSGNSGNVLPFEQKKVIHLELIDLNLEMIDASRARFTSMDSRLMSINSSFTSINARFSYKYVIFTQISRVEIIK